MVESTAEKTPQSQKILVPCLYNKNGVYTSSNSIQTQAVQLWHILCQEDTATTYQQAIKRTWVLLTRFFGLLSFLITALAAVSIWFCGVGFHSGWNFRKWLEVEQPSTEELLGLFFKVLLVPLEVAFKWSEWFVKTYFGWGSKTNHDQPPADNLPEGVTEDSTPA